MKFYHLINSVENKDVLKKITEIYDFANEPEGYKTVLETLREMKRSSFCEFEIVVDYVTDPKYLVAGENPYYDMYGRSLNTEDKEHYALDFESWSTWLNMNVSNDSLTKFDYVTILAVCLWEMTFHGYTEEEINNFKLELDKERDNVEENPDDLMELDWGD